MRVTCCRVCAAFIFKLMSACYQFVVAEAGSPLSKKNNREEDTHGDIESYGWDEVLGKLKEMVL